MMTAAPRARAPSGFAPYYGLVLEHNRVVLRVPLPEPDFAPVLQIWSRPIGCAFGGTSCELWVTTPRCAVRLYPFPDLDLLGAMLGGEAIYP